MSDSTLLVAAAVVYGVSALAFLVGARLRRGARGRWLAGLPLTAAVALVSWVIVRRWLALGHPPFRTLYESLLFWVWCGSAASLLLGRILRAPLLSAGTSLLLGGLVLYARALGAGALEALPATLRSPWFVPHVATYFFAYGALLVAAVAAVLYLASRDSHAAPAAWPVPAGAESERAGAAYGALMHRAVTAGFCLLTGGLILGAIWAKEAWGDYWTWDPKESWALVSWIAFAVYFHVRRLPGWKGRRSAWLVLAGFGVLVFTYLGIHTLPTAASSVHVY